MTFSEALTQQRWDDHRYYHHCRINQSLHLLSALTFLVAYGLLFVEPAASVLLAWLIAMPSRQIGHFFFEPDDYDVVNQATHEYKEAVKIGYNLHRKVVLLSIWILSPLVLIWWPTVLGLLTAADSPMTYAHNVSVIWLVVGVGAVIFRSVQLFFIKDVQTGLVWATKILTDPFHDVKLYHRSPLFLLRGERFESMTVHPQS